MLPELSKIKGIHPGAVLKREIKLRGLKNYEFANSIEEYPQTISSILKEKRGINPALSIKLGRKLNIEDDYFMLLQASYDVKKANKTGQADTPDLKKIRKILFWDTDFDKIDWINNKKAVIRRIFERGNDTEIKEIISFYGIDTVREVISFIKNDYLPSLRENAEKYAII